MNIEDIKKEIKERINHSHWDGKIYVLDDNSQPVEVTDTVEQKLTQQREEAFIKGVRGFANHYIKNDFVSGAEIAVLILEVETYLSQQREKERKE